MQHEKRMTAVLAALDTFEEVRDVLAWLRAQTAREELEIMLVCPNLAEFGMPPEAERQLGPLRLVECGKDRTLAEARADGCRAAETPYVAFFEDHAFPEPGWCEGVLARLSEGWSGVGGSYLSANPRTRVAQAHLLIGYGQWMHPVRGGEMPFIPGHGSAYSREMLMAHDDKLEDFLVSEALMMMELREQGYRFYCESSVLTWHFDASNLKSLLPGILRYPPVGHSMAAQRSRTWPAWRRGLFGLAFPAIALVRWKRAAVAFFRTRAYTGYSSSSLMAAAALALLWSLNEARGFWFGVGDSLQRLSDYEHDRKRNLLPGEWPHPRRPAGMSQEEFERRTANGKISLAESSAAKDAPDRPGPDDAPNRPEPGSSRP